MARTPSTQPTDGELEILNVLWSAGRADLGTIRAILQQKRPVVTTTIATMLKLMRDKGLVDRGDGPRGYVWSANITRKAARAGLIGRLIDLAFEGSARGLVAHTLETGKLSAQDRQEIRRLLDEGERKTRAVTPPSWRP
jgi:BlaI family transcriptional regulator, penicillinase repressor